MATRRLAWLKTHNYRNLKLSEGVQLQNLNILVGPNGSGKSNLVASLQFLLWSIAGAPDSNRGVTGFEDAVSTFGGTHILDNSVKAPAIVDFEFAFTNEVDGGYTVFDLALAVPRFAYGRVDIHKETLRWQAAKDNSESFYFYRLHDPIRGSGSIVIDQKPEKDETKFRKLESAPVDDLQLSRSGKAVSVDNGGKHQPVHWEPDSLNKAISTWRFYNANHMALGDIRSAEPKIGPSDQFLSTSGTNLALVIENLMQTHEEFEEILNQAIKSILPTTRRIRSTRVGSLSLNVELYNHGAKEPLYLYDLSDGTVRMLCWAVILLSPQLPLLLVIEEPEIGLHVAWMSTLADWIKQASLRTQVIVSTHSPDLLDKFTDCPENVYVFHPATNDKSHYLVKQLQKERLHNWLEEGYELGDLYRIGEPVIGGWPW